MATWHTASVDHQDQKLFTLTVGECYPIPAFVAYTISMRVYSSMQQTHCRIRHAELPPHKKASSAFSWHEHHALPHSAFLWVLAIAHLCSFLLFELPVDRAMPWKLIPVVRLFPSPVWRLCNSARGALDFHWWREKFSYLNLKYSNSGIHFYI